MALTRFSINLSIVVLVGLHATAAERSEVDRYGDAIPDGAVMRLGTVRLRHTSTLTGVAFSPDGKMLASTSFDGVIRLWNPQSGKPIGSLTGTVDRGSFAVAFSPNGTKLASVGEAGLVRLWEVATGKVLFKSQKHKGGTYGVAFAADGFTFATAGDDGAVRVWDTATGEELLDFETSDRVGDHHAVAFSPDGKLLASGTSTNIRLWNLETGEPKVIENAHGGEIVSLAFLPNGKSLISSGQSKYRTRITDTGKRVGYAFSEMRMWDVASGKIVRKFEVDEPDRHNCSIALSRDGKTLASVHFDKIRIWNVETAKPIRTIADYVNTSGVRTHGLAISPDGNLLAVRSPDHAVQLYAVKTGQRVLPFSESHGDRVWCLAASRSGKVLATGSGDQSVRLWDLDTGKQTRQIRFGKGNPTGVHGIAFSPDGELLAAAGYHRPNFEFIGFLSLRDVKSGKLVFEQEVAGRATAIAFSHNGKTFAVAAGLGSQFPGHESEKPVISLWDTGARKEVATLEGHEAAVRWMTFSPDGKTLTSVGERMAIRRWDVEQGKLLSTAEVSRHKRSTLKSVAFTPDGTAAVTSGLFDNLLIVSDLTSGQEIGRLDVKKSKGSIVAISADGRLLATASIGLISKTEELDESIRVWDLSSGRELLSFSPKAVNATSLTFTPDGGQLISGMNDGTVLVWDVRRAYETLKQER